MSPRLSATFGSRGGVTWPRGLRPVELALQQILATLPNGRELLANGIPDQYRWGLILPTN
jgi:hypothetical protein